ncbi:hypothetical protein Ae707Ps1_6273c [Pseudonocardia sp. Ae707_Ps1]|nr:hypothetical protein Ae707Ps1_6257c [Pseudonocardia sp. Ae707_Ps1]OLM08760.1 hypothetical protein Ae707Ps1_6273c [Pseudonocardia sp. Ae707_Ps1]
MRISGLLSPLCKARVNGHLGPPPAECFLSPIRTLSGLPVARVVDTTTTT